MKNKLFVLFITIISIFSCGSGTFENDPNTWNKVFGEDTPDEIEIINSRF